MNFFLVKMFTYSKLIKGALLLKIIVTLSLIVITLFGLSCLLNNAYKTIKDMRISKRENIELVITTIIFVCLFVCWCYLISK
jgi:hypothetical protein